MATEQERQHKHGHTIKIILLVVSRIYHMIVTKHHLSSSINAAIWTHTVTHRSLYFLPIFPLNNLLCHLSVDQITRYYLTPKVWKDMNLTWLYTGSCMNVSCDIFGCHHSSVLYCNTIKSPPLPLAKALSFKKSYHPKKGGGALFLLSLCYYESVCFRGVGAGEQVSSRSLTKWILWCDKRQREQ